jgi:hypothetical protein
MDALARRYGKLPTQILALPLDELALNNIILETSLQYEASARRGRPMMLSRGDDKQDVPGKLDSIFERINARTAKANRRR